MADDQKPPGPLDSDLSADPASGSPGLPAAPEDRAQGTAEGDEPSAAPETGGPPRRKKLSTILTEIAEDTARERVSVADLLRTMHGRAIAALMLIFAFPNILPSPPGTSGILGLPLVYLASQMMLGRLPWLPGFIAHRSVARADFEALVSRVSPVLARAERLLRPRLPFLVNSGTERIIGAICLLLSIILLLPIPFGNLLPALAISVFALGLLERDGVWIIAGLVTTGLAIAVVAGMVYALVKTTIFLVMNAFS